MKKEDVCVLIDSEEKRLRALDILEKAGEKVCKCSRLIEGFKGNSYYIGYINCFGDWMAISDSQKKITLDQLEKLLLPNYVVKDVHLTIDELKQQAEKLGFELVEKKREIKVGDFGVFFSVNEKVLLFDYLTDIENNHFIDSDGNIWQNFRHLTEEEKEKIQNNW